MKELESSSYFHTSHNLKTPVEKWKVLAASILFPLRQEVNSGQDEI